jgi:prefoldin alpha subunit
MAKPEQKPDKKQEAFQSKYMELQMLEQHAKRVQQQIAMLEKQSEELLATKHAITDIGNVKPNTDVLIPLAGGIFAKAVLTDSQSLLVNAGADTVVEKKLADVQRILDDQLNDISQINAELAGQLENVQAESDKITEALRSLAA